MSGSIARSITGGCQCGQVRYVLSEPPVQVFICHCRECQKQSASAFGISAVVKRTNLRLSAGNVQQWSRPTDSGRVLDCFFCPSCGSRLWHVSQEPSDSISLKGGSLDEPLNVASATHIWTSRRVP